MKILVLILLVFPLIVYGQKMYNGDILNKKTKERVPFATVGLIRENTGVNADENGRFSITAKKYIDDTLIISSVGYQTLKIPVYMFPSDMLFELEVSQLTLSEIVIKDRFKTSAALNEFSNCSINYWTTTGGMTQMAQQFESPVTNALLTEVHICKSAGNAIFRMRIYNMDSLTGQPSTDLTDTIIEVRSLKRNVHLDLKRYNIVIPGKDFFIAIEWLKIPYNENKIKKNGLAEYNPYISYKSKKAKRDIEKRNKVWQKNYAGKWRQLYNQSDILLISATVKY
jgi:hypothetical protein